MTKINLEIMKLDSKEAIEINLIKNKINEVVEEFRNLKKVTKENTQYYCGYIHGLKRSIKIIGDSK